MANTVVFVPGYGATPAGLEKLRAGLVTLLGSGVHIVFSLRFGRPRTQHYPGALNLQAAHVADYLDELSETGLVIVGHSEGASIALRAAFMRREQVRRLILVNPANMYRDFLPWLAVRIALMAVCDLFSQGGRQYWLHSPAYFANVWRSLREAWELCGNPILFQAHKQLAAAGVEIMVFQDTGDGVFSIVKTKEEVADAGVLYASLGATMGRRWMRHNDPATRPDEALLALKAAGAFDEPAPGTE